MPIAIPGLAPGSLPSHAGPQGGASGSMALSVIADSARFSVAASELADADHVGTALTLQTAAGFLVTVISIRLVGGLGGERGWRWAFLVLAPGPLLGMVAMWRLRTDPAAARLAGGAR